MPGRWTVVAAVLLCMAATHAVAQDTPSPEAKAEAVKAARAEVDRIIADSTSADVFENVTDSSHPQARHKPSGMVCTFSGIAPTNAINRYPAVAGGPKNGDDMSCATWWNTTFVSTFATRYPDRPTADQLFESAIRDIRTNWQNVIPFADAYPITTLGDQATPLVAAFSAERQGLKRATVVVVNNGEGWTFKVRATGAPDDKDITRVATLAFAIALPGGWEIFEREE